MKKSVKSSQNCNGLGSSRSAKGQFKSGTHWRPHGQHREKKFLHREYVSNQKSASEIAAMCGVTDGSIFHWLARHGIIRRTVAEARKVKHWIVSGEKNGMYGKCGAENPRFIDGSSPERQRLYAHSFWKELSRQVLMRDYYKCVRCGSESSRKNRLHAHHVKPWAGNPDFRFELSNIVSVCGRCHQFIHSKANIKKEILT